MARAREKHIWTRMEKGMKRAGYSVAVRIHKDLFESKKREIVGNMNAKYPTEGYDRKWYMDHNGYHTLFVRQRGSEDTFKAGERQGPTTFLTHHGETQDTTTNTAYGDRIVARLMSQISKGKEEYGQALEYNVSLGYNERVDHLADELTDGLQYIEHMRDLLDGHCNTLAKAISDLLLLSSRSTAHGGEMRDIAGELNESLKELNGR